MASEDSTVHLVSPLQNERRSVVTQAATVNDTDAKFESLEAKELARQCASNCGVALQSNHLDVYMLEMHRA
jgi:translation initiation factor 1 (eIF-1/SUI1)